MFKLQTLSTPARQYLILKNWSRKRDWSKCCYCLRYKSIDARSFFYCFWNKFSGKNKCNYMVQVGFKNKISEIFNNLYSSDTNLIVIAGLRTLRFIDVREHGKFLKVVDMSTQQFGSVYLPILEYFNYSLCVRSLKT